jgi:hypothetical protein
MTPLISSRCVYDPEVLMVMTNAFDRACDFLPAEFRDSDHMRRKLALHIFHQVDDGESDPARLADSAILSLLRQADPRCKEGKASTVNLLYFQFLRAGGIGRGE